MIRLYNDPNMFGRLPDPPEPPECYGYYDNPKNFDTDYCRSCTEYDECLKVYEGEMNDE